MKILFIATLNQSLPHTSSTAQTMIQGVRPFHISAVVTFAVEEAGLAGMVPAESSRLRSAGDSQSVSGGQISFIPLKPAKVQISQNGTISEKNGSWRPTMAPRRNGSRPVTEARPWIGVPSAP